MRTACVLIALVAVVPPPTLSQPSDRSTQGAAYAEVLSTYGDDPAAAVRVLTQWPRSNIERGLVQLPRTPAGNTLRTGGDTGQRLLQQMALLHTEAAFAHSRRHDGDQMDVHLEWAQRIARHDLPWPALDALRTPPVGAAFHTEWALLVAGFFQLELALADARRFVDGELKRVPEEPRLLLARGITEEIGASERAGPRALLDAGAQQRPPERVSRGRTPGRRVVALEAAASLYRRALAANPVLHEARIRLGRSLFDLGHAAEAQRELEQALAQPLSLQDEYLATLFVAALHEQQRRPDEAQRQFARAASLFPAAQAPYLALSRLQAQSNPEAAGEILLTMFGRSAPAGVAGVADPFWVYDAGLGASMAARLDRLRAEARGR